MPFTLGLGSSPASKVTLTSLSGWFELGATSRSPINKYISRYCGSMGLDSYLQGLHKLLVWLDSHHLHPAWVYPRQVCSVCPSPLSPSLPSLEYTNTPHSQHDWHVLSLSLLWIFGWLDCIPWQVYAVLCVGTFTCCLKIKMKQVEVEPATQSLNSILTWNSRSQKISIWRIVNFRSNHSTPLQTHWKWVPPLN